MNYMITNELIEQTIKNKQTRITFLEKAKFGLLTSDLKRDSSFDMMMSTTQRDIDLLTEEMTEAKELLSNRQKTEKVE